MSNNKSVMPTYSRFPIAFDHGEGTIIWDENGKRYLDFLSGIGVNNLGHCHPKVVEAIRTQAGRLIHTSNLYGIPAQEKLADRLTQTCFADQVFFCNSGAEANEAAIKMARKSMRDSGNTSRFEIITAINSFHGRTLATLTATGQEKVHRGFDPLVPGFRYAAYNDIEAIKNAITAYTAAILVEPIQGEAGIQIPDDGYLAALRKIADDEGLLLILDEVQTGMGRTGKMWCHQWTDVVPDIMTCAKALASGLPMGACLASKEVAKAFSPGTHGSTFGGSPLVSTAALATLGVLLDDDVLSEVNSKGDYLLKKLNEIMDHHKLVKAVRGKGLMAAIELNSPAEDVVSVVLTRGLLLSCQMGTIIRILPPLTVSFAEIDEAVSILDHAIADVF
ncbi:MAG: aspartate aminotransferase family protein [Magnetococcales bacterium]|nr:aspartate aminotransferase family protein [Magnetococcales bacterium]